MRSSFENTYLHVPAELTCRGYWPAEVFICQSTGLILHGLRADGGDCMRFSFVGVYLPGFAELMCRGWWPAGVLERLSTR